jgi:hypothetical protein
MVYVYIMSLNNTHCFSTSTMVTRKRLNVTLYVHCLYCFYIFSKNPSSENRNVPCGRTDGRAGMTKLTVAFWNSENAPRIPTFYPACMYDVQHVLQNTRRLFPCTVVTDWFSQLRQNIFTARYELGLYQYTQFRLISVFQVLPLFPDFGRQSRQKGNALFRLTNCNGIRKLINTDSESASGCYRIMEERVAAHKIIVYAAPHVKILLFYPIKHQRTLHAIYRESWPKATCVLLTPRSQTLRKNIPRITYPKNWQHNLRRSAFHNHDIHFKLLLL